MYNRKESRLPACSNVREYSKERRTGFFKGQNVSRLPFRLDVEIYWKDARLGRFNTRDIDFQGLFLETKGIDLYLNDIVELTFLIDNGHERSCTLRTMVVRHEPDGVGLLFLDYDDYTFHALKDVFLATIMVEQRALSTARPKDASDRDNKHTARGGFSRFRIPKDHCH